VALRCIDNLKTLLAPFLPFTSQRRVLGYTGRCLANSIETFSERARSRSADLLLGENGRALGTKRDPGGRGVRDGTVIPQAGTDLIEEERARLGQLREIQSMPGQH
jgi:hypothetical protein